MADLKKLLADPRYWDGDHPDHASLVRQVSEEFEAQQEGHQAVHQTGRTKAPAGDLPTDIAAPDYDDRLFESVLRRFQREEGGIAIRPPKADKNRITNKGVSENFLASYNKKYPSEKLPSDPRDLSDSEIARMLRKEFFDRPQLPKMARIPGLVEAAPAFVHQFFDAAAQHGDIDAGRWMQEALAKEGFDPRDDSKKPFDGIVGSRTRRALEEAFKAGKITAINNDMVDRRIEHFKRQPEFSENPGWLPRAERLRMK
ncbi:MAG TPA: glycosyl hydrolase 108 family protein [Alphaproteobacteria bacterium]|nr:glycosyl hydrolase 108 family protein [Alphaproteobacteria bacterium]